MEALYNIYFSKNMNFDNETPIMAKFDFNEENFMDPIPLDAIQEEKV